MSLERRPSLKSRPAGRRVRRAADQGDRNAPVPLSIRGAASAAALALAASVAGCKSAESGAVVTFREAVRAVQAGDDARADRLAAEALQQRPGFIDPLFLRASLAERWKDYEGARSYYRDILAADPTSTAAATALAQTYIAEGRFDDAADWLRRCVEEDPGAEAAMFNLGVLAERGGDQEVALAWFRLSAFLDRRDPRAVGRIAAIRQAQGRSEEAAMAAEEALRRAPDYAPARAILDAARKR